MELSQTDLALLAAVQENSRLTNRELAARCAAAESTTHERLRRLVRNKVITRFTADVDLAQLGRPLQALIAVQLRPQTEQVVEQFLDSMLVHPCVLDAMVLSGSVDAYLRVAVSSHEELRRFAWRHVTSVRSVAAITTHIVYEYRHRPLIEGTS
jgi:DNA-binding Lrp family transcriptional regulator